MSGGGYVTIGCLRSATVRSPADLRLRKRFLKMTHSHLHRPPAPAPRHLNGFKQPTTVALQKAALEKLFDDYDRKIVDIVDRLAVLERGAGIAKAATPEEAAALAKIRARVERRAQ
jgi:hypothetical protein